MTTAACSVEDMGKEAMEAEEEEECTDSEDTEEEEQEAAEEAEEEAAAPLSRCSGGQCWTRRSGWSGGAWRRSVTTGRGAPRRST
jgi:hypothetical protein